MKCVTIEVVEKEEKPPVEKPPEEKPPEEALPEKPTLPRMPKIPPEYLALGAGVAVLAIGALTFMEMERQRMMELLLLKRS